MKKTLLIALLILPFISFGQNIKEYKATNGITYHLKDTVRLGRGAGIDGIFLYLMPGGVESIETGEHSSDRMNIRRKFTNAAVIIKKITSKNINGIVKYTFTVKGGFLYPFNLSIDDAIQVCEVIPCKAQ